MRRVLSAVVFLCVTLMATRSGAIDAPPGAEDLGASLQPLTERLDAEHGRHRLLLLLSPA